MTHAPAPLGRGAVVGPDAAAPGHLADAPRVVVDDAVLRTPGPTVDRLHRLWATRQPYVVDLRVDPAALLAAEQVTDPVFALDARFLPPLERLRHLVWANTVDHRGEEPMWWHAVKASRAIAGLEVGGPADVVLPDGRPAWVDGGPRQPVATGDDAVVLHRDDTERGVLAPSPPPVGGAAPDPGPTPHPSQGGGAHVEGLAPDQAEAVLARSSAVRVAAPAGSGKTRVLTARLAEVLRHRGTPTDTVLALAYNTAAAAELRARSKVPGARAATVHAHALAILRRHVGDVEVLGEVDVRRILNPLVDPPRKANVDPLQAYIDALEQVRTALVSPEDVEADREDVVDLPALFTAYRAALGRRGAVDFPEMVYRAVELLLADPAIRRAEQARVGQVLVDEFQDLTPAYLLFIRLLASPQLQCFGVGDDDQVIYGHAGATPDYLLHFDTLFPGAEDHPLTVNYRCPAPVVEGAVRLLGRNQRRLDKVISAAPGAAETPLDVRTLDTHAQAGEAGRVVAAHLADGGAPADIAVLARVRVALLGTQAELTTRGIPCRSPIGEWLLERTGVRTALTYLRLATDEEMSGPDIAEILHRPLRPIPSSAKDRLRRQRWSIASLGAAVDAMDGGGPRRAMQDLVRDLDVLRRRAARQPTAEVLRYVNDVIGLGEVVRSLDHRAADAPVGGGAASSHIDDVGALIQVADHCPDPAAFEGFLRGVVAQPDPDGPAVRLSTIHSVKGLEWPTVVLVGAVEGTLPHRLATTADMVEEERRVFHVAMTRARQRLVVIAPKAGASRFVAEATGAPSPVGRAAAPRPTAGTPARASRPARSRAAGARKGRTRIRAAVGLQVRANGGVEGVVETVTDEGALVRTPRGALLRVRFGDDVHVDGSRGTLARPA